MDLELEDRAGPLMQPFQLTSGPVGLHFALYGYDGQQRQVVRAAFTLIEGQQAFVNHIETDSRVDHRKGYATAAVVHLIRKLGVPIVPVDERKNGLAFWRSLRAMPITVDAVKARTDQGASSLLVAVEAARLSKLQGA